MYMKLLFKQKRFFAWFSSYDIYNEKGDKVYTVERKMSWIHILNHYGEHIGTVKKNVLIFLPKFELYVYGDLIGHILKKFAFFNPSYNVDFNGWRVFGNVFERDYSIIDKIGNNVAVIIKKHDTYLIDLANDNDALYVLMITLAMDTEKCSKK